MMVKAVNEDQWVTSFLGLKRSSKFVIEDGNVLLVNCPLQLLENINLKDPLGDTLLESLQCFHTKYGCGINSFLCLWSVWNKGIRCLLKEGFEFSSILETLSEGLGYVISSLKEQEISLEFALPALYRHRRNTNVNLKVETTECLFGVNDNSTKYQTSSVKSIIETNRLHDGSKDKCMEQKRCLIYSYRLYNDDSVAESSSSWCYGRESSQMISNNKRSSNVKSYLEDTILEKEMAALLNKISHGCNSLVSLIKDIWQQQLKNSPDIRSFSKEKILTFAIPGSKFSYSTVIDGIVSRLPSFTSLDLFTNDKSMPYRCLLIGGSLTPNYVHLGFAPDVAVEKITYHISESDSEIWLQSTVQLLHKLKVSALLVQGIVDKRLVSILQGSMIIVSKVPHSSLNKLAISTGKSVVTYVENSDEMNICNIIIEPLQLRKGLEDSEKFITIKVPGKFVCQSVIICHELLIVAEQLEHSFWHMVNRLSNICSAKRLLPGRGQTEKFCIRKLQELNEKNNGEKNLVHKIEGLNVLSDGFKHYSNKIETIEAEMFFESNTADDVNKITIYDDPVSKVEGWKAALKLALLMSQVDSVIVNDFSATTDNLLFQYRATL